MGQSPEKIRQIDYQDFQHLIDDVQQLLHSGYQQSGNWNLAQTAKHVSQWMSYPMDGFPNPGIFFGAILWIFKVTGGKKMAARILNEGFKSGLPTDPKTVHKPESSSDQQAVEELISTARRIEGFTGQFHDSPLYGKLDHQSVLKLHLKHAAHHFSFLKSKMEAN